MDGKYFSINDCSKTEIVKDVAAVAPDVGIAVLPNTFVIEAVDLCNLPTLMVASDKGDSVWIANLEGDQQKQRFDAMMATVHKVAQEEIIRVGTFASHPK